MSYDPEPEIQDYLDGLAAAAQDLPQVRRDELLGEIEQHIREAVAEKPCANRDEMLALLAQVGDPAEIAAAAQDPGDAPAARPERRRLRKRAVALVALALLIVLAAGLAAYTQTYQPLAFAPADVLARNTVNTYGEGGHGVWIGYRKGIGKGPNRPFVGVTFQNTGHFTVRVLGVGKWWPPFPVMSGWSSRLLMAQGSFVEKPVPGPGNKPVRVRFWRHGPLQPFHPVDLAPGQIVMLAMQGVWHADCSTKPYTGQTVPPRDFPVKYSFLWKTTTSHIPLPSGLRIAPVNHHPLTDCHKPVALERG